MGFKKRTGTTWKVIITNGTGKKAELILFDIVTKIETHNIHHKVVFNMDQTHSKYIHSSRYTMEKSAIKFVAIAGFGDKGAITATFIINLAGNFFPMQLNYGAKQIEVYRKLIF